MTEWLLIAALWVGGFVLLIAAAAYLLLPILIKTSQYSRARPAYEAVGREHLPPDVLAFMDRTVWELQSLGYVPAALLREVDSVPDVTAFLVITCNQASGDSAAAIFTIGQNEVVNLRTPTVIFETKFADGTAIETGNFADAGTLPPNPKRNRLNIPNFADVRTLAEIHRRRRERFAPRGAKPVLPEPGREVEAQIAEDVEEKERVRAAGYYYLDEVAGVYRPTWKGAYLMTWKLMFPVAGLRRWAKRVKAKRQLRELGLDPRLLDGSHPSQQSAPFPPPPAGSGPVSIPPGMPQRPIT